MQTAAKNSLVLMDFSSSNRYAGSQVPTSHGGFYQLMASSLIRGVHREQVSRAMGDKLVVMAEHAHAFRRIDVLDQVSQILQRLPLPRQYAPVGRYYQALCIHDFGRGDVEKAASVVERVMGGVSPRYKAKAMLSLGSMFVRMGDNQSAMSLFLEALSPNANKWEDPLTTITTLRTMAVLRSMDGDHRGALSDLEDIFPAVRMVGPWYPHLKYDYMNSLAVELCEVGRLEEAKNVSQIVLASPFARAYPEWRETREEIELRGYRASRGTVAVSQRTSEGGNLVCLPVPERQDSANRQEHIPGQTKQPARVLDLLEWKRKMGKEPNGTPRDKTFYKEMDGREMLLKIMELTGSSDRTDDELERILEAIDRVLSEPKDTGKQ